MLEVPLARRYKPTMWQPPIIKSLEDTGLPQSFVQDMALKMLYFYSDMTGYDVAEKMHLPFQTVVSPAMDTLKRRQLCEIKGSGVLGSGSFLYTTTTKGVAKTRELLERTTYVGPAPVPWETYIAAVKAQARSQLRVRPDEMRQILSNMILNKKLFAQIGPAVNSGKTMFLYGPAGNGKTTIAESIGKLFNQTEIYIPHATIVDGQIIKVYDEINHIIVPGSPAKRGNGGLTNATPDTRWLRVQRPVVMVGGELTMDGLELIHDPINKYYEAPFQMKANGGMLLVDDFGRQQIRPRDLLNRWIVPLEKRADFLSLRTGRKLEVPFEVLLIFCTNLPPRDLVDEAFLRRIRHKIEVTSPSYDDFRSIFKKECGSHHIPYDEQVVVYLLKEHYVKHNRGLRANHPRDLLEQVLDVAAYLGTEPRLTPELIDQVAASYFVDLE